MARRRTHQSPVVASGRSAQELEPRTSARSLAPPPSMGLLRMVPVTRTCYVAVSSSCFSTLRLSATAFFTRDVAIPPMSLSGPLICSSTVFVTTVPRSEDSNS